MQWQLPTNSNVIFRPNGAATTYTMAANTIITGGLIIEGDGAGNTATVDADGFAFLVSGKNLYYG